MGKVWSILERLRCWNWMYNCQSCFLGSFPYSGYDGARLLSHWRNLIILHGLHWITQVHVNDFLNKIFLVSVFWTRLGSFTKSHTSPILVWPRRSWPPTVCAPSSCLPNTTMTMVCEPWSLCWLQQGIWSWNTQRRTRACCCFGRWWTSTWPNF